MGMVHVVIKTVCMFLLLQHLQNIEYKILESLAWKEVIVLIGWMEIEPNIP